MSTTAIDIPRTQAPSSVERWYVLLLMCLIYSINIADRYVVSTVLEPIRLELKLNDAGVAFLTGIPLAFFYVIFGIQPPQHPGGVAGHLVGIYRALRSVRQLSAIPARPHRRRRR